MRPARVANHIRPISSWYISLAEMWDNPSFVVMWLNQYCWQYACPIQKYSNNMQNINLFIFSWYETDKMQIYKNPVRVWRVQRVYKVSNFFTFWGWQVPLLDIYYYFWIWKETGTMIMFSICKYFFWTSYKNVISTI